MGELINFQAEKTEREPHAAGWARCILCYHRFVAVVPIGVDYFECPNCGFHKAVYESVMHCDLPHWQCNCGNQFFHVTPKGIYCPNCGEWQAGWDDVD